MVQFSGIEIQESANVSSATCFIPLKWNWIPNNSSTTWETLDLIIQGVGLNANNTAVYDTVIAFESTWSSQPCQEESSDGTNEDLYHRYPSRNLTNSRSDCWRFLGSTLAIQRYKLCICYCKAHASINSAERGLFTQFRLNSNMAMLTTNWPCGNLITVGVACITGYTPLWDMSTEENSL